jgi:diphthamide biosynthesis enzyme Dph1/Dph2-like protein
LGNDCKEEDEYLLFGYYGSVNEERKNIMVVCNNEVEEGATEMTLCEKVELSLKSLSKMGQKLYYLGDEERDIVTACQSKTSKRLMQRYSMISQLEKYSTFGIIVSNTGTSFFQAALQKSLAILNKQKKKTFVFMMSNFLLM